MTTRTLVLAITVLSAFASPALADQLYILFDPACMDRVEYDLVRPEGKDDYITYHANIRSGEKLILEVGIESQNLQNYLPQQYLSCQTGGFDQALVDRINANIDEVFVIYPRGNDRYTVSPVTLAAYYQKQGNLLTYISPKYRFRFNSDYGVIGTNIAYENPGVNLYFEGEESNGCQGVYIFRQLAPQSAYPVIFLKLLPELGIIEESYANSGTSLTFEDINEIKLDRYIRENCGVEPGSRGSMVGTPVQPTPAPSAYNTPYASNPPVTGTTPAPPAGLLLPPGAQVQNSNSPYGAATTTGAAVVVPTNPTATMPQPTTTPKGGGTETHTVARGETLYGISRQYNVTVAQLQEWNNLGSSTIQVGQQLRVASPQRTANTSGMASRGPVASSNPGGAQPVPYDQGAGTAAGSQPNPNERLHIVKAGETVASLALKYGYTETRFREINDLGPNDFIKVGQRLNTSDCVCPEIGIQNTPATSSPGTVRPQPYEPGTAAVQPRAGTPAAPYQPQTQPQGTVIQPQTPMTSRGVPSNYNYPTGTSNPPQSTYNPAYTAPSTSPYGSPQAAPPAAYNQPFTTDPGRAVPSQTYTPPTAYDPITNEPEFGSVIPRDYNTTPNTGYQSGTTANPIIAPESFNTGSAVPSTTYPATPGGSAYNPSGQPSNYEYTPTGNYRRVHIVQTGDTLYSIARRYGMTPERLMQLNGMTPGETIIANQKVYIE